MEIKEQLSILKQGVDVWNGWRAKNIYVYANFNEADLNGADLRGIDLRLAHLRRANLFRADLRGANFSGADLSDADLRDHNLSEANLNKAKLSGASLSGAFVTEANLSQANLLAANLRNAKFNHANLSDANLTKARLSGISLRRADLSGARLLRTNLTKGDLVEAKFIHADLKETNVSEAKVGGTVFADSDLRQLIGLDSVDHCGPSHISIDTFTRSEGQIPEIFLRGCGLSDWEIEESKLYNPALNDEEINTILHRMYDLRAAQALQTSPLFVSYSNADDKFVDKMGNCLKNRGIRYWRDIHVLRSGRMEQQIDKAIRQNPRVLLILSEHSLSSDWIEREVRTSRELEREIGRKVLCPIALDDSWKSGRSPKRLMEQIMEYNILDLSEWKDDIKFDGMIHKLIDELELFPKGKIM